MVWDRKYSKVNNIASTKQYLLQWKFSQINCSSALSRFDFEGDGVIMWIRSQGNPIKITVDVALFGDRREYGLGVVARDSDGRLVVARMRCYTLGDSSRSLSESRMRWGDSESNCLTAVQAIRSKMEMRSSFGQVVVECRWKLRHSNNICLLFIKRSANLVAHCSQEHHLNILIVALIGVMFVLNFKIVLCWSLISNKISQLLSKKKRIIYIG